MPPASRPPDGPPDRDDRGAKLSFAPAAGPASEAAAGGTAGSSDRVTVVATDGAAPSANAVPVPGYEVLEELGRGGMGVVYKARHLRLGRVVALKMLLSGGHAGAHELARFRLEAEAVARLQHPNIVQLYEAGDAEGRPFFALELVEGGSLARRLDGTPLPPGRAAALLEALARAMHYAHEKGVVHRDLKPANVLLAEDGTPKVADFGLAKRLEGEAGQTQSGALLGTPSYMAPEQALGRGKEVGPAADVYSLGAILYELLTGRPPFKGATLLETLEQVRHQEAVPPTRLALRVPRDLETICLKCLEKAPRRRYASAADLADDLRRFSAGEPVRARPVGALGRALKWARRRPAAAALVGVSVAAALGLALASALFTWRLSLERDRAEEERQNAFRQEEIARGERDRARAESARARQEEAEARRQLRRAETARYLGQALLAERDLRDLNVGHAEATLDGCRADLRHFEHALLAAQCRRKMQKLCGHAGRINAVAFLSPDAERLATAGDDGAVLLWDLLDGRATGALLGHTGRVTSLAWSAPTQALASAGQDGTVRLWDVTTGRQRRALPGPAAAVAFSPDGRLLAAVGGRSVKVRDAATGRLLRGWEAHPKGAYSVAFSPDGRRLATGGDDRVKVWDAATGQEALSLAEHKGSSGAVAFSPDGRRLAAAFGDWKVRLWDAATGKEERALQGDNWIIHGLAFSPDSRYLAAALANGPVKLYDAATGQEARVYRGHSSGPSCVAFSADGRRLASAGPGPWDAERRAFTGGEVRVWDALGTQDGPLSLPGHAGGVPCVAYSPAGDRLASAGADGTVKVSGAADGPLLTLKAHTGAVHAVAFRADGRVLASAGADKLVRLWGADAGEELLTLAGHTGAVRAVAFSPDGRLVATASDDRTVRLWEAATGRELRALAGHKDWAWCVAFSPDGRFVVSGGRDDHAVRVWETAGGPGGALDGHAGQVHAVAFSPDGRLLASAGADQTVRLWDVATWREVGALHGHAQTVTSVSFSGDGRRLATGSGHFVNPGEVKVWELSTGQEALTLRGLYGIVSSVAFRPDGRRLAVGSGNPAVLVWDAEGDGDPTPRRERAAALAEATRRWPAAAYHLGRLLERRPVDAALYTRRGLAHAQAGLWDEAVADFDRARALRDADGLRALRVGLLAVGPVPWGGAADDAVRTADLATRSADAHYRRGLAREERADAAGSLADYDEAVRLDPGHAWALDRRGNAHAARGDWPRALADLDEAVRLRPASAAFRNDRGALHQRRGDLERALADLNEAVRLGPGMALARANRGLVHALRGEWEEAAADQTEAIRLAPSDALAHQRRGAAHARLGRWERAAADLARAAELAPRSAAVGAEHAVALLAAGDRAGYRDACAALCRRFEAARDFAALDGLARACLLAPDAGVDLTPLLRRAEEAPAAAPGRPAPLSVLGRLLYRCGRPEEAAARLGEACRAHADGGGPADWFFLALAHHCLGREAEARRWLDRARRAADEAGRRPFADPARPSWADEAVWRSLRKEAEAVIEGR
jgi:WD40 repeat protein/tetratricopeptide (TPR) repeat protein